MSNPKQCVFASHNVGKCHEIAELFEIFKIDWAPVPQSEFGIEEVEETGTTFVENAILKARHAAAITGLPALADDSGLVIDALDGAPGVHSARYAGEPADFNANINKVLHAMQDQANRRARFVCVFAWMRSAQDPLPIICQGFWEGQITQERHGDQGFGYDPIFFHPESAQTAAQMDTTLKNQLSHRTQATDQLAAFLGVKSC